MNLKKLGLGLVALVGFGLLITLNAFTNVTEKKAYSYWQYNLNTQSGSRTGSNYTQITNPESPGCDDVAELPCVIRADESINSATDLTTYLTTNFANDAAVTAAAFHKKSME